MEAWWERGGTTSVTTEVGRQQLFRPGLPHKSSEQAQSTRNQGVLDDVEYVRLVCEELGSNKGDENDSRDTGSYAEEQTQGEVFDVEHGGLPFSDRAALIRKR